MDDLLNYAPCALGGSVVLSSEWNIEKVIEGDSSV